MSLVASILLVALSSTPFDSLRSLRAVQQWWSPPRVEPPPLRPPPSIPDGISQVARDLVDQGAFLKVPVKGKVKPSINKGAPMFAMPGGPSSVVLLQLPDYQAPYSLTVKSQRRGIGRTTEIFIPSGLYFDADFQHLGGFGEEQLTGEKERIVAVLTFAESHKNMRYLLLYTRGDLIGQRVNIRATLFDAALPGKVGTFLGSGFGLGRLERSLEAKLAVERSERTR